MKKYCLASILIVVMLLQGCSKEETDRTGNEGTPHAVIVSATKVSSGGNPSIRIVYRLTNTSEVSRTLIANLNYGFSGATNVEVPTADGEAIIYDHGNSNQSANYYFIFNMQDGSQKTSNIMTFYF